MSNQDVGVCRDAGEVAALPIGDAIAHEHGDAVEFQPVDLNAGVAEVMYIAVKPVDISSVEAIIVVAANEDLVAIWQVAEPIDKINGLLFAADHAEVARMHYNIGLWQILKPMVATVSVRQMQYSHALFICKDSDNLYSKLCYYNLFSMRYHKMRHRWFSFALIKEILEKMTVRKMVAQRLSNFAVSQSGKPPRTGYADMRSRLTRKDFAIAA